MSSPHVISPRPSIVAGLVRVMCTCCAEAQRLVAHAELEATQLVCPGSKAIYLDRGDGLYEQTGDSLAARVTPEPEILSDRPARTGPKSRIELERATFAEGV